MVPRWQGSRRERVQKTPVVAKKDGPVEGAGVIVRLDGAAERREILIPERKNGFHPARFRKGIVFKLGHKLAPAEQDTRPAQFRYALTPFDLEPADTGGQGFIFGGAQNEDFDAGLFAALVDNLVQAPRTRRRGRR